MRCARPAHSPLHCNQNQGDSRRHQSCRGEGGTTAGEFLKPIMWPIIRSTPDARPGQPQTKKRKCGIQPAHQSLFTDVFGSRLLLCTIHQCKNFTMSPRGDGKPCAVCLTGDIRMGWSGRAPAPPASEAGKGRQRQGARHVSDTQYRNRRDRHRYRQELPVVATIAWAMMRQRGDRAAAKVVAWPSGSAARPIYRRA